MANVTLAGFNDFRDDLMKLPARLQYEAEPIVRDAAEDMAEMLREGYAVGKTGNLWKGIRVSHQGTLSSRVRSTARHAHLYEFGTVSRHTKAKGANRGKMPAKPVFIPSAIRARERMLNRLRDEIMSKARPGLGEGSLG